jgi:hypothetical protein
MIRILLSVIASCTFTFNIPIIVTVMVIAHTFTRRKTTQQLMVRSSSSSA